MVLLQTVRQLISHKKLDHRKDKDIFEVQSFCNCRYLSRNTWTSPQSFILKMCLLCKYIKIVTPKSCCCFSTTAVIYMYIKTFCRGVNRSQREQWPEVNLS